MTESIRPKVNYEKLAVWITLISMGAAVVARIVAIEERQDNQAKYNQDTRELAQKTDERLRQEAENRAKDDKIIELNNRVITLEVREQTREALEQRRRRQ